MASVDGSGPIRASITEQMRSHARRRAEAVDDVVRTPRPEEKPHPRAQWDEAAGRWEIWSDEAGGWVSLEDGSVQAPGTPSVEPLEEAVPPPVPPS